MNRHEAVEALKNFSRVHFFAEVDKDGCISGGSSEEWIKFGHKPASRILRESFLLTPLRHGSDLWSGRVERYDFNFDLEAKPLDQLVNDLCDLYAGHHDDSMSPTHVIMLLLRLTQAGFFVRHEGTVILGSVHMNFVLNDFWVLRIGSFYVAYDVDQISGFGDNSSIVCSRSINTVIKSLKAYYDRPRRIEP